MNTLHDTTRTYPRTMSQAFADERAHCIEGPVRSPTAYKAIAWALFAGGVAVIISVFFQGAP